jgi:hypothetical protein
MLGLIAVIYSLKLARRLYSFADRKLVSSNELRDGGIDPELVADAALRPVAVVYVADAGELRNTGIRLEGGPVPTYVSWYNMIQRCTNPKAANYKYYGQKKVTVCKRWLKFSAFSADMGIRKVGTTLDRKNPAGNYSKGNCQSSDASIAQALNKRKPSLGIVKVAKASAAAA